MFIILACTGSEYILILLLCKFYRLYNVYTESVLPETVPFYLLPFLVIYLYFPWDLTKILGDCVMSTKTDF